MKNIFILGLFLLSFFTISAQKIEQPKWSFTAEYGFSSLDGDGDSSIQPAYGTSVEYSFLPFAGLALDYYYFPLRGPAFQTNLNSTALNLSFNINRILFSKVEDKVILKGYIGYGIAGYTSRYISATSQSSGSTYNTAYSFPVLALSVEFYLSRLLSVGAKSHFRPFNVKNLEGDPRYNLDNVNNDNIVGATVYLRIKIYSEN